jgi:multidrug efflux pump subunit AcrA (membrane-fusion protein)
VLVVVAATAASLITWQLTGTATAAASTTLSRTVTVSPTTISQSVSTTATIEPSDQEQLNFGASGVVTSVRVAQGDTVTKGQVLSTIDSAALQASLAQAQASLAQAQARVASDEASSSTTSTQLSADQAAVTADQGQVSSAQTALSDATLTSPIAGVVASVSLSVGEQVSGSAGSSSNSARNGSGSGNSGNSGNSGTGSSSTAEIEVIGTSSWEADATVDATQLSLVKNGMQAQITLDGARTPIFGTVSSVAVLPTSGSSTASYPVVVAVTGTPTGLHAGATATAEIIYQQLSNVLTVPTLALHTNTDGSTYVVLVSGGKQSNRTVTTGTTSGGQVQITSGLQSGDQVLVQISLSGGLTRLGRTGSGSGSGTGSRGTFGSGGFGGGGFGGGLSGSGASGANQVVIGGN